MSQLARTYEIWWLKMAAGKAHISMENQIEGTSTKFIINKKILVLSVKQQP